MGALSNFLRRSDPRPDRRAGAASRFPLVCRPARREEVHAGLRLVLGSAARPAHDVHVLDFLQFAIRRGIDLNDLWLAERGGKVLWAALAVVSPGRTMLILAPAGAPPADVNWDAAAELLAEACARFAARGVHLAQALVDPGDGGSLELFHASGFRRMAELLYLQAAANPRTTAPALPPRFTWRTYSPQTHAQFAETITRTYHDSLDCPPLNGLRDIEDVIAGHKVAGEFDPRWWFLLCEQEEQEAGQAHGAAAGDSNDRPPHRPRAVLLLSRAPHVDAVELVYVGIVPEARGRGLGDLLVRQALSAVAALGRTRLALAVDSINTPALKIYRRNGLRQVGSKIALMRVLDGGGQSAAVEDPVRKEL